MPVYIMTVTGTQGLNRPGTWQGGEVRKYSDEGSLLAVQLTEEDVSPAAWTGQGAYDPKTGLFWYTIFADPFAEFGSSYVASFRENPVDDPARPFVLGPRFNLETPVRFSQERFDVGLEPYEVPIAQAESVLVGPDDLLYVGYQQRPWNDVGVEDELWRPMETFLQTAKPEGVFGDRVRQFGLSQFGHQNTAWLCWGRSIIFTDETRIVKILDVESGEVTFFCDLWGTAPEGFLHLDEIPDSTYEDNPRGDNTNSGSSYGIQVSHKKQRIYISVPIYSTSTFALYAGVSVWDFSGKHCATFRPAQSSNPYSIALSESDTWLWVTNSMIDGAAGPTQGDPLYPMTVYRMDAWSGEGLEAPLFTHEPTNGRFAACVFTERTPWGEIPTEMRGDNPSQSVRWERSELT